MIHYKPWTLLILLLVSIGCVQEPVTQNHKPFKVNELDACLIVAIDMSGSFQDSWEKDGKAFRLFFELMEQFFTEQIGSQTEVILGQISGNDQTVIFQGSPEQLKQRFRSPEEFSRFLKERSDPSSSPVYDATHRIMEHVNRLEGVTENTRLMTVILSDMNDSEKKKDKEQWKKSGHRMLKSLTEYRELGGALAMYFVDKDEMARWRLIIRDAGFTPGMYVVEDELVDTPQLPKFD